MKRELIATVTFGLEAVVRREIENLGYEVIKTEDGKVTFAGYDEAIARANLWLRSSDRVLLKMSEFHADEFEELYQRIRGIAWEELIPADGRLIVDGSSVKSKLSSVPACQSVSAKAIYERLCDFYAVEKMPETGALYRVKVTLLKDMVTVTVDTTGEGLHKRGYRVRDVEAPIKETLAAALVQLSFYKKDRLLVDLCTGSGTIPIEAAMIARNIAPGLSRKFISEEWEYLDIDIWRNARKEAFEAMSDGEEIRIHALDIDKKAVAAAKANAMEAGVDDCIHFDIMDMAEYRAEGANGIVISNPPYGMRIGEEGELKHIYETLKHFSRANKDWSLFIITMDKSIEEALGRKADRRRKLYNGRLETCYYQFHGEKPEKSEKKS